MNTKTFKLTGNYIELIKLLKLLHIAKSGAHAKFMVENGEILLNDKMEIRKRAKLRSGDIIETGDYKITIQ